MRVERLFQVLVVQGALLGAGTGCFEDADDTDPDPQPDDTASASDTAAPDDSGTEAGACDDVCENTNDWQLCLADGVQCCWATGVCCDDCCGHLAP